MPHGRPALPERLIVDPSCAQAAADVMQALATPSRLRILACLHRKPTSVSDLAAAVEMESSAVSHQLRLLRHQGLVVGNRDGRKVVYELHDTHVAELLEQVISHLDHVNGATGKSDGSAHIARK